MSVREALELLRLKRDQLERRYGTRKCGCANLYVEALNVAIGALAASVMILEGGAEDEREGHQVGSGRLEEIRIRY